MHLKIKKIKKKKKEKKKEKGQENRDEEYIEKEKFVKENINKFIVDEEKGIISKIKERNNNTYILEEIDIYPIKVYTQTFGKR